MAYAVEADIVELYSGQALYVADRDGDGTPDSAAVTRALQAASAEIDGYLAVRYDVPVDPVPAILVQLAVDIGLYRLALSADVLTEEHRRRYEDAVTLLQRLADGKAALPPPPADPEADPDAALDGPRPIVGSGPEKLFTRDTLRDL